MKEKPSLAKRKTTAERVIGKIVDFVETFISGIAAA
jgi:type I restriction enzyme R subunit